MKTVFESLNLRVKVDLKPSDLCVVTFDSYTDTGDLNREAFGETFFAAHNVSVVHIVNARNDWYHNDDWQPVMDIVGDIVRQHRRSVAYGSSMGGYAALSFADILNVSAIVAISPQYHMARHRAPFETRWRRDARRVAWRAELDRPLCSRIPAVVVYDPCHANDRKHVELIAMEACVTALPVPYSGHPAGTCLAETGLLGPLILGVIQGDVDIGDVARLARARRHVSLSYFSTLAVRAIRRRPLLAVQLARKAVELEPGVFYAWLALGNAQRHAGMMTDAVTSMHMALKLAPDHPSVMAAYGEVLAYNGETRAACRSLISAARISRRGGAGFALRTASTLLKGQLAHLRRLAAR